MILKKMTEYNERGIKDESFILIIEEREEGWELSRKEMLKLQKLVEQSLKEFAEERETEYIPIKEIETLNGKYQEVSSQVDDLAIYIMENVEGEPSMNEGAIDTAIRLLKSQHEDQAEECPDFIEPPAPEVICDNGACTLVLEETEIVPEKAENLPEVAEEVQKEPEKVQKQDKKIQPEKDYASYVQMVKENKAPRFIRKAMVEDLGLTDGTAENYFYTRVKPEAMRQIKEEKDRANEKEKKRLADHLEKKIQVIPTFPYHESKERVHFTEEEKERIRNQASQKW